MKKDLIFGSILITLCVGFVLMRGCDKRIDHKAMDTSLPVGDVEKLVVNPDKHTIQIITPGKEQTLFLPDRPSSIEIGKDNHVTVTSKSLGTEIKPFFGLQASNAFRIGAGTDLLYYKKLDLGIGGACQIGMHTPVALAKLSYTVYDNTQLGITFDTSSHVGVLLSVRL